MTKFTPHELADTLNKKPVLTNEPEIKEVFALLGFKLKEYHKASFSASQSYEVHYKRNYLVKVRVDDSRCLSISNEYVDFSEGSDGVSMGGIDTVAQMIGVVIYFAQVLNSGYDGVAIYNRERSHYTEEEYKALIQVMNENVFKPD
jgi:hypothetical protein